jgi:hypothetical protein
MALLFTVIAVSLVVLSIAFVGIIILNREVDGTNR